MGNVYQGQNQKQQKCFQQIISQSQKLHQIKGQICLQTKQIYQFYKYFSRLDRQHKGYLQIDDFIYEFSKYDQNFVQLPYLEYLFTLIKKQKSNIVFFQELVIGIAVFCLMNNQSVLQFVFDCIDKDDDTKISKQDIKKFVTYRNPINNKQIFFTNFTPDIQKLKLKQNQTILDFDQFRSNYDRLHFLIWPAYKLQQTFRKSILGQNVWYQLYSKAQKRQYQIKNNQKKEARLKQKLQILKSLKIKQEGPFFKTQIKKRKAGQISTDIKTQSHVKKIRRKSCYYLKPSFKIGKQAEQLGNSKQKIMKMELR